MGLEGIGCEPASAVTLAGLKRLVADGRVGASDTVVLLLTAHTLKDADYTIDFHRGTLLTEEEAAPVETEMSALRRNAFEVEATPEAVLAALQRITAETGSGMASLA
jgi:threonine synthase